MQTATCPSVLDGMIDSRRVFAHCARCIVHGRKYLSCFDALARYAATLQFIVANSPEVKYLLSGYNLSRIVFPLSVVFHQPP